MSCICVCGCMCAILASFLFQFSQLFPVSCTISLATDITFVLKNSRRIFRINIDILTPPTYNETTIALRKYGH